MPIGRGAGGALGRSWVLTTGCRRASSGARDRQPTEAGARGGGRGGPRGGGGRRGAGGGGRGGGGRGGGREPSVLSCIPQLHHITRCSLVPRPSPRRSSLALRAIERRPGAQPALPDPGPAHPAGLAFARVNEVVELKIAGLAARIHVIAQRASALRDSLGEYRAPSVDQPREPRARNAVGPDHRPDACPEQRLVRVDVADPDDESVVHERELDCRRAAAGGAPEIRSVERRIERLGAEGARYCRSGGRVS